MHQQVLSSAQEPIDEADDINFLEAWRRLRGGWRVIALTTILASSIAAIIGFWMTPIL